MIVFLRIFFNIFVYWKQFICSIVLTLVKWCPSFLPKTAFHKNDHQHNHYRKFREKYLPYSEETQDDFCILAFLQFFSYVYFKVINWKSLKLHWSWAQLSFNRNYQNLKTTFKFIKVYRKSFPNSNPLVLYRVQK